MNDNIMSMEEIENMLKGAGQIDDISTEDLSNGSATLNDDALVNEERPRYKNEDFLSQEEQDVLGEIGNICMGTSATTMYNLLGKRVNITTPRITVHDPKSLANGYKAPMVVVDVNYVKGIEGKNLLVLNDYDVALMTDVLMGGDGNSVDENNVVLDEMHISAIREVMNQMVGSSATSLANIINTTVDISTPSAHHVSLNEEGIRELFAPNEILVKISFDMVIEDLLESKIMQIIPIDFAKTLADKLIGNQQQEKQKLKRTEEKKTEEIVETTVSKGKEDMEGIKKEQNVSSAPKSEAKAPAPKVTVAAPVATNNTVRSNVVAHEVEYPSFDAAIGSGAVPVLENIALLANVPMRVTVQLGKAKKKVKEILEFNNGSVIVLDKLAGEPVDILVNDKHIAKGEVVVVDDSYGVRITEIDSAAINDTI